MSEESARTPTSNTSAKNRLLNSSVGSEDEKVALSALNNAKVNSYSHKPNIVPPYVLDALSQAHYKDQLNNTNVNANSTDSTATIRAAHSKVNDEDQFYSFANDPFVKSMNNNWHNFLHSVQQPITYPKDVINFDEKFTSTWKLNDSWGGDDRLKMALLGSASSDEDTLVKDDRSGFFSKLLYHRSKENSKDSDSPKVRSKAGYWMSDEKRADILPTLKRLFVQNPLVPLFLRILIAIFSLCALALACTIFVNSQRRHGDTKLEQQASTIMAIVVQCIAIVYVVYIAYDEYHGKPLGLRDPLGKMKLLMLDLLFIIFSSANLSLAFNTLFDREWVCEVFDDQNIYVKGIFTLTVSSICRRQRALASFLFLVLCLWVLTFTISIIRVIERVNTTNPKNM
ncbi:uncharacterized protein PRCAT00001972001 [Priceomyces carsonii]|uniref:uncharacterized protein n=1 Tax=Priceomyces carsonii TaxID=28549 RepID=UPI002ED80F2B|nr:unnamed protein product [Priceomyces carsonii]